GREHRAIDAAQRIAVEPIPVGVAINPHCNQARILEDREVVRDGRLPEREQGGGRTRTEVAIQRILSPLCLLLPPIRRCGLLCIQKHKRHQWHHVQLWIRDSSRTPGTRAGMTETRRNPRRGRKSRFISDRRNRLGDRTKRSACFRLPAAVESSRSTWMVGCTRYVL